MMPYYLSIGMTAEQYLYGENWLPNVYTQAEEYRFEARNQDNWLKGLYYYKGINAVIANFAKGFGGKGGKMETYYEYPIALTEREKKAEKQRNIERTLKWVQQGQEEKHGTV